MKRFKVLVLMALMLPTLVFSAEKSIKFNGEDYVYRWSGKNQYEFTPTKQTDLKKWEDMLTIVYYPNVKDGNGLAAVANNLLGLYNENKGKVLKTDSIPRTKTKPAEHFIAVVLGKQEFLEFVQVRLKINEGIGSATVYSHKIYGKKVGNKMSEWLKQNGGKTEQSLMTLKNIPSLSTLKKF